MTNEQIVASLLGATTGAGVGIVALMTTVELTMLIKRRVDPLVLFAGLAPFFLLAGGVGGAVLGWRSG